ARDSRALPQRAGAVTFAHTSGVAELPPCASLSDIHGRAPPELRGLRAEAVAFPPGLAGLPERGFELLSVAPSPHGLRLQLALEGLVAAAGVASVRAEVQGFRGAEGRLR